LDSLKHNPDRRDRSARLLTAFAAAIIACAVPRAAEAHLVTSGAGPFYDGVAHFFVSPLDLLVVIALAMSGGLGGAAAARGVVLSLPFAWLMGAAGGMIFCSAGDVAWITALTILVAGLFVAVDPRLPRAAPSLLAGAFGAVHGFFNGCAMTLTETSFLAALGIAATLTVLALLIAASVTAARRATWQRIAVRTLGSWITAIGALFLAWRISG